MPTPRISECLFGTKTFDFTGCFRLASVSVICFNFSKIKFYVAILILSWVFVHLSKFEARYKGKFPKKSKHKLILILACVLIFSEIFLYNEPQMSKNDKIWQNLMEVKTRKMSFGGNRIGCPLTSCESTVIEQNIFEKLALGLVLDRILCQILLIFVMLN